MYRESFPAPDEVIESDEQISTPLASVGRYSICSRLVRAGLSS